MGKILFITIVAFMFVIKAAGQIEGIVIDKKKMAIINALIIVSDNTGKSIDTVKSDNRGGYAFKGLTPGEYNVEAKATGFETIVYKKIIITTPPEEADEGDDTYYAIRLDIILAPAKK